MYEQLLDARDPSTYPCTEPDVDDPKKISQDCPIKKEDQQKRTRPYHRKTAEEKESLAAEVDR